MEPMNALAILITIAALFAYVNHRAVRMPMSISLMLMSLVVAVVMIIMERFGLPARHYADLLVKGIDFSELLLEGMLGLLLFAGALHVNLDDLYDQKLEIGTYATLGVVASTFLVGSALYATQTWFGLNLRWIDCLLFGALISPTDPIAVLGILKKAEAPKTLETKISGESLFNDGIGVVVFLVLLEIAVGHEDVGVKYIAWLFAKEAAGGLIFGLATGYAAYILLKSVDNYQVEIFITLALVIGGYRLASHLHLSAPLAMVAAGLLIGNHGRRLAMSEDTRKNLDTFWELIDEILNAILFVLIGLEALVLTLHIDYLLAGLVAIPIALFSRFVSVGVPSVVMSKWRTFAPNAILIMTWGGLRGGISVALALSLPESCNRDLILTMTYVVVVFSILIQGTTVKNLVKK